MRTGRKIRVQTIAKVLGFKDTHIGKITNVVTIAQFHVIKMTKNNNLYNLLQAICNILQ